MIMTRSFNLSRGASPVRRGASPIRSGDSPVRRGASPVRRGGDDDDRRHLLLLSPIRLPMVEL